MTHSQTFPVTGMSCQSCVKKITQRLLSHPDITDASVTLDPPEIRITTRSPLGSDDLNAWLEPLGHYRITAADTRVSPSGPPKKNAQTYRPLIVLLAYLVLVVGAASTMLGHFDYATAMRLFMGGFFVAFSFFKMLDLAGFSDAYRGYDLVAKAVPSWGRIYPFVELGLGLAYLANWQPMLTNAITAAVMGVSLLGVLRAVWSRQTIRCACLGTVFNLPMSTVTIVEDGVMLLMALLALVLPHGV